MNVTFSLWIMALYLMHEYFLRDFFFCTTFSACKIYVIPQE